MYIMSPISRRGFLRAAPFIPFTIAAGCRSACSPTKHDAFGASAEAFAQWIREGKFSVGRKEFEEWRQKLPVDLHPKVKAFAKQAVDSAKGEYVHTEGSDLLLVSFTNQLAITGKTRAHARFGGTDVHRLFSVRGEDLARHLGHTFHEAHACLIYEEQLREFAKSEMNREHLTSANLAATFRIPQPVLDDLFPHIQSFIDPPVPSVDEFMTLSALIAQRGGVPQQNALKMLLALSLFVRDARANNKFKTEADKDRATKDFLYNIILHELVHAQLASVLPRDEEVFPIATELAYGKRPFNRLAAMMYMAVQAEAQGATGEAATQGGAQAIILQAYQELGYRADRLLTETSPNALQETAQQILHRLSMNNFQMPFANVFDMKILSEIDKFVRMQEVR
jgi:hypothetical protein